MPSFKQQVQILYFWFHLARDQSTTFHILGQLEVKGHKVEKCEEGEGVDLKKRESYTCLFTRSKILFRFKFCDFKSYCIKNSWSCPSLMSASENRHFIIIIKFSIRYQSYNIKSRSYKSTVFSSFQSFITNPSDVCWV